MSTVVVFGATGYAGSNITRELLDRGHRVTAVARDTTKLGELADRVTVASGDLHDQSFLTRVTQGADVVVVALPARALVEGGPRLVDAVPALNEAVAAAGARLGVVGGAGSLRVSEGGPRLVDTEGFPAEFRGEALDHADVLDALRAQDRADWFYLSPAAGFGGYNPGTRTGAYRTGSDVLVTTDEGASEISGADYAVAFVDEIETPRHHGTRFCVAY